jgi:elongation factor Ts
MEITAANVKELREKTGLGMMICKKALTEANGDMDKAIEDLRKQGQATMEKRAGKAANEGKVAISERDGITVIYEVNSETDFVARNEDFIAFTDALGDVLLEKKPSSQEEALELTLPTFDGIKVADKLIELTGKIGEKNRIQAVCSCYYS